MHAIEHEIQSVQLPHEVTPTYHPHSHTDLAHDPNLKPQPKVAGQAAKILNGIKVGLTGIGFKEQGGEDVVHSNMTPGGALQVGSPKLEDLEWEVATFAPIGDPSYLQDGHATIRYGDTVALRVLDEAQRYLTDGGTDAFTCSTTAVESRGWAIEGHAHSNPIPTLAATS